MKKTFREEHWLGSKEQFTEHLVRFYWDLADGAEVPHWIDFEIYPVIAYTMEDVTMRETIRLGARPLEVGYVNAPIEDPSVQRFAAMELE